MKPKPSHEPANAEPLFRPSVPSGIEADVPWARRAAWIVIGVGALALAAIAGWFHPVGDYLGETDFYGGYVEGARSFQAGRLDPARYGVVGPAYDVLLGLVAWAVRDFFVAGKLIAIASAVATWVLWRGLVARCLGDVAALWATAIFVANPVFFQAGYSVVSHGTAVCLQVASLAALLRLPRGPGIMLSGALAAIAALVRYPGLVLLPAAWLILWFDGRRSWQARMRSTAIHLAGFLLVALPWTVFSLSRGQVPAQGIFGRADFYLAAQAPNPQDDPGAFQESQGGKSTALPDLVRRDPGGMLRRFVVGAGTDLVQDARQLLGYPVAALVLLGFALAFRDGKWRRLLPLGAPWLLHAIVLAPVYYNSQYALVLLPFYAALAGVGIASPRWALSLRGLALKPLLAVLPLALAVRSTVAGSRSVHRMLPVEVREAGEVLARSAAPGQGVIARKGHIGYYSGRPVIAFPRVETIEELAAYCRARDVHWMYFSWFEAHLRPELLYLLDPTAAIPGLEVVHVTRSKPSWLFRTGPGFGTEPAWWSDQNQRRVHIARGAIQVLSYDIAWYHHLVLAIDALERQDPSSALRHADAALRGRPEEAQAWELRGIALHELGRTAEAREAYRTALRLQPGLPTAERGLRLLR